MMASNAEFEEFWELATRSGLMDMPIPKDVFLSPVMPEDLASVLQSVNEMGSWISHYLMNSISTDRPQIPPELYSLLAVIQNISREIVSRLSPCQCETCRPRD